jgi:hypothetical protein
MKWSEMEKMLVVDDEEKSVDAVFCERVEISGLGIRSIRKRIRYRKIIRLGTKSYEPACASP